jgi:hypothetical protein|tara:strand:- start:10214 stop:10624 length:411 start_codon:yes stop_codon:yes gene_type:complete
MAYSSDADLLKLIPDILSLGIESFFLEHPKAEADIQRELRIKWWPRKGLSGEMDNTKLTGSQFVMASTYLVMWRYALPQLTNWVDGDRFGNMIDFYKARYGEELEAILSDGVDYDSDGDGSITQAEKEPLGQRLDR